MSDIHETEGLLERNIAGLQYPRLSTGRIGELVFFVVDTSRHSAAHLTFARP